MHILPLAQSQLGKKILPAGFAKLPASGAGLELLKEVPQLEPGQKIAVWIEPLSVAASVFSWPAKTWSQFICVKQVL
jgi:hypothetical protein